MSEHAPIIKKRFRSYFLKVLLWIPVAGLASLFILAFAAQVVPNMPSVLGALGFALMLGVVGGALVIHRNDVRCPACNVWVKPVGINGVLPPRCPNCSADFR